MEFKVAELRHRVEFQSLASLPDGQGGSTLTWATYQECWAKLEPSSGGERVFAQKLQDDYDHTVTIRNTLDHVPQKAADRIKFGNRLFQIKSIQFLDERKWFIKIKVKEGVAS